MNPIDVHVLHSPNENQIWWRQCNESLKGHPINVYHVRGIEGDMWTSRLKGFSQGDARYVSFVDPDDIVAPQAFAECLSILENDDSIGGVYTNSEIINEDGNVIVPALYVDESPWTIEKHFELHVPVHQLFVVRRTVLEQALILLDMPPNTKAFVDYSIFSFVAAIAPWYFHNTIGYKWRKHSGGVSRHLSDDEREEIRIVVKDRIKQIL